MRAIPEPPVGSVRGILRALFAERILRAEAAVERSRNLRHFVGLQRVLRRREQGLDEKPDPPYHA